MLSFDEMKAKIQSYVGQFLGLKAKLLEARSTLSSLVRTAEREGSATIGDKTYSLAELQALQEENTSLVSEGSGLERRLSVAMDEMKRIQDVEFPDIPGIALAPAAIIAWVAGASILAGAIAYFMSRVKDHLDKLAKGAAKALLGLGTIAVIAGAGFLALKLFGGKRER